MAIVAIGGLGVGACGDDDDTSTSTSAVSTTAASSTTVSASTTTTTVPADTVAVHVYLVRGETLGVGVRRVVANDDPHATLVEALLAPAGPDEAALGLTTQIPVGTTLRSVDVVERAAVVDLSSEFASGGGSLAMQLRIAQLVYTVTQLGDVDTVTVWIDGAPVDGLGGEGIVVNDLTRADGYDQLPMILLEAPGPGETITSPVTIAGTSSTFEATVNYTIAAEDGTVLAEGMTMATAGSGTWGTFTVDVELDAPGAAGTTGTLSVYDISEADGVTREGEVTIPIVFG
jgi:hypothetical protein